MPPRSLSSCIRARSAFRPGSFTPSSVRARSGRGNGSVGRNAEHARRAGETWRMANVLRPLLDQEDERALLRFLAQTPYEVYPRRVPPDWKPFVAAPEAHDRLPASSTSPRPTWGRCWSTGSSAGRTRAPGGWTRCAHRSSSGSARSWTRTERSGPDSSGRSWTSHRRPGGGMRRRTGSAGGSPSWRVAEEDLPEERAGGLARSDHRRRGARARGWCSARPVTAARCCGPSADPGGRSAAVAALAHPHRSRSAHQLQQQQRRGSRERSEQVRRRHRKGRRGSEKHRGGILSTSEHSRFQIRSNPAVQPPPICAESGRSPQMAPRCSSDPIPPPHDVLPTSPWALSTCRHPPTACAPRKWTAVAMATLGLRRLTRRCRRLGPTLLRRSRRHRSPAGWPAGPLRVAGWCRSRFRRQPPIHMSPVSPRRCRHSTALPPR